MGHLSELICRAILVVSDLKAKNYKFSRTFSFEVAGEKHSNDHGTKTHVYSTKLPT